MRTEDCGAEPKRHLVVARALAAATLLALALVFKLSSSFCIVLVLAWLEGSVVVHRLGDLVHDALRLLFRLKDTPLPAFTFSDFSYHSLTKKYFKKNIQKIFPKNISKKYFF